MESKAKNQRTDFLTMYFNRGAFVTWSAILPAGKANMDGLATYASRYGIIECELTTRPGWYYVRNEHGDLDVVQWSELRLAPVTT